MNSNKNIDEIEGVNLWLSPPAQTTHSLPIGFCFSLKDKYILLANPGVGDTVSLSFVNFFIKKLIETLLVFIKFYFFNISR